MGNLGPGPCSERAVWCHWQGAMCHRGNFLNGRAQSG